MLPWTAKDSSVRPSGMLEMVFARETVAQVWRAFNFGLPVVTSGDDGKHRAGSLHYVGLAEDYRTNDLPKEKHLAIERVRLRLGQNFDVVFENIGKPDEHLHVEYDPS